MSHRRKLANDAETPEEGKWGRVEFLGSLIDPWTMARTVDEIQARISAGYFTQHVAINVAKLIAMRADASLREAIEGCEIVSADGMGIVWGAKLLGLSIPERVTGVDLFFQLLFLASERRYPVYILGGTQDVVGVAVDKLKAAYPRLLVAGYHHGYFWGNEAEVVQKIAESGAMMLFVAISSPQKEAFVARFRELLGVRFVMGVGGTIDIVAGVTKRAPAWMQSAGMEWLFRLFQEPGRMWKRYLVSNAIFLGLLIREGSRLTLLRARRAVSSE